MLPGSFIRLTSFQYGPVVRILPVLSLTLWASGIADPGHVYSFDRQQIASYRHGQLSTSIELFRPTRKPT